MQKRIIAAVTPDQLCKGLYVILPTGWLSHPFLRNEFIIDNDKEIRQLKGCGYKNFDIDLERSKLPAEWSQYVADVGQELIVEADEEWDSTNLVPEQLREALHNTDMNSMNRSEAVYTHSKQMMQRLMQSPSGENIKESKKVIWAITELILTDNQIADNLLKITSHDYYTYTHCVNVGFTSIILAKSLFKGLDAHNLPELGAGFFLHDIGKVMVRPEVINKKGLLTDSEMQHMRIHPYQGYKLLKQAGELTDECRYIVMQHHERDDGSGYPKKLVGDEIHTYAKICCISDVFDALTSKRSYKKAMPTFDALKLMKEEMLGHFDKTLFAAFVNLHH